MVQKVFQMETQRSKIYVEKMIDNQFENVSFFQPLEST